jgi:uncharacterized protein YdaU (DUF1376 family)
MNNKSSVTPAFQFYPDEWLSSKNISLMTPAEEGGYIRLLCYQWNDPRCTLPDDDPELAVLSRLGAAWQEGSGERIRKCFEARNGRLRNDRLYRERRKQIQNRIEKRAAGAIGAAVKRQKKLSQNHTDSKQTLDSAISRTPADASSSIPITITSTEQKHIPLPPSRKLSSTTKAELTLQQQTWFDRCWDRYWRREGKQAAVKAFRVVDTPETAESVFQGVERQRDRMLARDAEHRPHFSTWLNQRRWEDETEPEQQGVDMEAYKAEYGIL